MKHALPAMLGLMMLAAPVLAADPPADAPPMLGWSSVPGKCNWVWREGRDTGVWTEDCHVNSGHRAVAYDAALDRYVTTIDGKPDVTMLRQFREAGGPVALAAKLQAEGLLSPTAECRMTEVTDVPGLAPQGWTAWQFVPTGALKEAFDKEAQQQIPEPPCGPLGYRVDTVSFFMVKDDAPDRVFFVDLGQESAFIDIKTLRLK